MRWILNVVYILALILIAPWLIYRSIRTGRYREGLEQKLFGRVPAEALPPLHFNGRTIWLHGVSVGEIQLLRPLVTRLRQQMPDARFLVSTTTRTGMELAQKLFADVPTMYLPFDFSWSVARAVTSIRPSLIILGELELWPNLIDCAARRHVPVAVVNARLSLKSFHGYRKWKWLTGPIFRRLSLVAAQDPTYGQRFIDCGVEHGRVQVTGSIKFDNVVFDRSHEKVRHFRSLMGLNDSSITWIVGSTQDPEERYAAEAFLRLSKSHSQLRLIVVPRHPERFETVVEQLKALEPLTVRRSQITQPIDRQHWKILVVDTVGELRWWWGLADLALVGGSFGTRGGQNMLEPAAYGANVAFGPNTANFKDISQLLLDHDAAQRLDTLEAIETWASHELRAPVQGQQRGLRAQALIRQHQGALEKTANAIEGLLNDTFNAPQGDPTSTAKRP